MNPTSVPITLIDDYVGPGYGRNEPGDLEIIRQMARTQGLLFDPVYTAKAFRGLGEEVRNGRFKRGSNILFMHTGGIYGLFPRRDELTLEPAMQEAR
jgi:D-cysteine desulfhydrase